MSVYVIIYVQRQKKLYVVHFDYSKEVEWHKCRQKKKKSHGLTKYKKIRDIFCYILNCIRAMLNASRLMHFLFKLEGKKVFSAGETLITTRGHNVLLICFPILPSDLDKTYLNLEASNIFYFKNNPQLIYLLLRPCMSDKKLGIQHLYNICCCLFLTSTVILAIEPII